MPYFFICPVYVLLVLCLLITAVAARFTSRYRDYAAHIVFGTVGTLPGFLLGNALFWALFFGFALFAKKVPLELFGDVSKTIAAVGFAGVFVGGLALANVVGVVLGFLCGLWLRRKVKGRAEPGSPGNAAGQRA